MNYEDFIGTRISAEISPYQFRSEYEALRFTLNKHIVNQVSYWNGLLCSFEDMTTVIEDGKIIVSGTVTQCEVDC